MALELKLSSSIVNYTSLNLIDTTGAYGVSNTGGWGTPNIELSVVPYVHLFVTLPNGSIVDIDAKTDLGLDFNTITPSTLIYNITSTLLYGTFQVLPDGIYSISYQVFDGSDDCSTNATIMTYYTVQKSVYDRIQLIPNYYVHGNCNNRFISETSSMFMLLQALIASSQYSNTVRFEEILSGLTDIMTFDANTISCGC